jgi:histidinol-phosphatase
VTWAEDLALGLRLAEVADAITTARCGAHDLRVDRKPDRSPVTDADLAVEDAVRAVLAAERPSDAVVGEERGGPEPGSAPEAVPARTWLLDPIDGTKNFLRGVPAWATLIGLVAGGLPVVGVASAPALGRRWWAARGDGAWVATTGRATDSSAPDSRASGAGSTTDASTTGTTAAGGGARRISVSAVSSLADAYVSTTHLGSWEEYHSRAAYLALVDACWENRAFGDFWQHCLVAEGAIDLAAEPVVNAWDLAALQVIVEEAGGGFTDLTGARRHDGGTVLTSNGLLHQAALRLLRSPAS